MAVVVSGDLDVHAGKGRVAHQACGAVVHHALHLARGVDTGHARHHVAAHHGHLELCLGHIVGCGSGIGARHGSLGGRSGGGRHAVDAHIIGHVEVGEAVVFLHAAGAEVVGNGYPHLLLAVLGRVDGRLKGLALVAGVEAHVAVIVDVDRERVVLLVKPLLVGCHIGSLHGHAVGRRTPNAVFHRAQR